MALLLDADDSLSPTQIDTALKSSTTTLSGTEPDIHFGYGLVNASGAVESIGTVSDCQIIDTPGEYVLDQDISGPFSSGVCLYVTASDVTIDGQGHTIDGVDGTGRAVFVEGMSAANPVANVTVTNVTVESADLGVAYQNVTASTVEGVTARNQTRIGVGGSVISDVTFENITSTGNEWGAHAEFSSDVTISGSNLSANNDTGLNFIVTTNATVTATNITANNNNGVWADGSTNVTVTGNNVSANGNTGIHLPSVTDGVVADNEITDNHVGVVVDTSTNVTVEDNVVESGTSWGIQIIRSDPSSVTGNQLDGNAGGVQLFESDNGTISDNVINGSIAAPGIGLESSTGVIVTNNTVTHTGPSAFQLSGATSDVTVTGNNISANNDIGINLFGGDRIVVTDNKVSDNEDVGIAAGSPINVTIERNTIEANAFGGLTSTHGQTLTVRNNTIAANPGLGVYIENASDATVTENEVTGTTSGGIGVEVTQSPQALVSNNVVESSDNWGIMVTQSDQSLVSGNDLETNGGGIRLFDSADSTVTGNLANGTFIGIYVENATGTQITDNTATNNSDGIDVINGSNNVLRNNTATGNVFGVALVTTDSVTAERNDLSANDVGTFLDGATAVTFVDTEAADNANAALYSVNRSTVESASNFTLTGGESVDFTARDVALAANQSPPAIPSGTNQTGPFLDARNTSDDGWIEFTLDYDESTLSSTVEESTLRLWRYDGTWSNDIGGTNTVDTANDTVTANVTTFSTFTLLAEEVPEANVTPATLDFGDVNVDDSPTLDVTIANDGVAPLNVSDVSVVNDTEGEFTVTSGGSGVVQPGNSMTVMVEFAPSDTGAESATLTITHNDTDASPSNVSLSGTGVAPNATVSPDTITYGNVSVGAADTAEVTVANNGSAPLNVTAATVVNDSGGDFTVTAGASQVVQPGGSATITVEFGPGATGPAAATLSVEHNASGSPDNVSLSGTGVSPNVSVTPDSLAFGEVHVNTTDTKDVTVTNDGTAPLNVSDASVADSDELAVNASFAPFVLAPGDTQNVTVDFAPTTTGEETGTLSIANNATNDTGSPVGPVEIAVNGTGVGPNASVTPASIDFGNVSVGGSATANVTIENDGNASLEVTDVSVGGDHAAEFDVTAGGGATTIAPGDTHNVTVEFAPSSSGEKGALLNVSHNASAQPSSVSLAGTGIAPSANVTPSAVDYGDVNTSATANETVTVENDGTAPLNLTSFAVEGADAGQFTVVDGGTPVLQPGDTETVTVQFAPDAVGAKVATLVVEHNASDSPANVSLAGTGVAPDVSATPADALAFGDVNVSDSVNESVVIENNGSAPLDLSGAVITGPNASRYSLPADPTPVVLAPGETQAVTVQFAPDSLGDETAYLNVTHNASRPAVNVTLNGTGVDAQPPTFAAAAAANATDGTTVFGRDHTVTVNATVADNLDASVTVTVDASVLGNGTVTLTDGDADGIYDRAIAIDAENATDGSHELTITANDSSGNANVTTTNEITVDTTNATLDITAPANDSVTNRTWVRVDATAADATSGVDRVQVNDGGWTAATLDDGTWTHNFTGLADGVHTFEVRAVDNASNVGPVETITVTVDTTPPVIEAAELNRTADIPPEGALGVAVNATDATAGVGSAAAADVSLTQSATWWNGTVEAAPAIGNRTLSVTVVDAAGNANTTDLEYRVGVEAPLNEDNQTLSASPGDDTIRNVTINVSAGATVDNETVFVGTSRSNPTPNAHPDDVALYFPQVNVSVANADIDNATLTVTVAKSRVDETNADLNTVAFWVFESGTWNATTGTLVDEDATHLTYEIEAPHFSTYAITADTVTASGGGGGGGGGTGGDGPSETGLQTSVALLEDGTARLAVDNSETGETVTLSINGGLGAGGATLDAVDLTFAQDRKHIEIDLRPHDSRPAGVPALEQAVSMGYVTADTAVPDRAFDQVVFHFSVDESALPGTASLDDVALYRFDGNTWSELETSRDGAAFTATSPGFSVFAVGASWADISVADAALDAEDLALGEAASVSVTLENEGPAQGDYTVELLADGAVVATTEATVPGDGSETVTLSWTPDTSGSYEVVVDEEAAGTLVVEEDEAVATSAPPAESPGDGLPTELPGIALVALLAVLALVGIYVYRQRSS